MEKQIVSVLMTTIHQKGKHGYVCSCNGAYSLTFPSCVGNNLCLRWGSTKICPQSGELPNGSQWEKSKESLY